MTKAIASLNHNTYGGVYYCASFTGSGAQPVWTRLTTTGLPGTGIKIFGIDPSDPLNKHYAAVITGAMPFSSKEILEIYYRNGGNWSLILDNATLRTVTGSSGSHYIGWMRVDPTTGTIWVSTTYDSLLSGRQYVLKSTANGTTWTSPGSVGNMRLETYVDAIGNYVWLSTGRRRAGP